MSKLNTLPKKPNAPSFWKKLNNVRAGHNERSEIPFLPKTVIKYFNGLLNTKQPHVPLDIPETYLPIWDKPIVYDDVDISLRKAKKVNLLAWIQLIQSY